MIIYIEQVLIDNFIINLFIILTLKAILRANFKKINMILSSLTGSVLSLILPLFCFNFYINFLFKILTSLFMIIILKKYIKFKEYFLHYLSFLLISFLFGGVCLFILINFDKSFIINNYSTYSLPLGIICIIAFFLMIIVKNIFKNFYNRKNKCEFLYKINIFNKNTCDELLGYLDSGNTLIDNITKKPIIIVEFDALKNTMKGISLTDIILNKYTKLNENFNNVHIFTSQSIGLQKNKILVLEVEKLEIYSKEKVHIINKAIIGLTLKNFINEFGYQALLNPYIF